jgi:hypothetical protein
MAFDIVFGLFVVAFLFLSFWTLRWAIRRDKAGRYEWMAKRDDDNDTPSS